MLPLLVVVGGIWTFTAIVDIHRIHPVNLLRSVMNRIQGNAINGDDWDPQFTVVQIPSSFDGSNQPAYFLAAKQPRAPFVISLHTWGGTYTQNDELAERVAARGWGYLHPNVRGANRSPEACLSPAVLADIDDVIRYSVRNGNADPERIFVVGASGGGYTALGAYLRTGERVHTFIVWNPISDLASWHAESLVKNPEYADDIERCAGDEMVARSPLSMTATASNRARIEIFAGLNDGHDGSVPITHSLRFFNKVAAPASRVSDDDLIRLLRRNIEPKGHRIVGRAVYFWRTSGVVAMTIFEGGHEMLYDHTISRIESLSATAR